MVLMITQNSINRQIILNVRDRERMEKAGAAEAIAKVSSIFIYPVKSCRGISVSQAPLTPTGMY